MPVTSPGSQALRRLGRLVLAVTALCACTVATAADPDPDPDFDPNPNLNTGTGTGMDARLERMAQVARTLNYSGVLVYSHPGGVQTIGVTHQFRNGREHERLQALNGSAREVIREGERITCILPDSKQVLVRQGGLPGTAAKLAELKLDWLENFYAIKTGGADRVAGRDAEVMDFQARDQFRYGYRLWQDTETGLLVRFDMLDGTGRLVESMMFTELEVMADAPASTTAAAMPASYQWDWTRSEDTDDGKLVPPWLVMDVPPGFRYRLSRRHGSEDGTGLDQFIYSDGLATVSVFVERLTDEGGLNEAIKLGALNSWARPLDGFRVTAIGEVPVATVRLMAESLERRP
ncbi:MAG: MucB/RseB C-terminal domain-containing protein [Gammaproteobacteria bacterium]